MKLLKSIQKELSSIHQLEIPLEFNPSVLGINVHGEYNELLKDGEILRKLVKTTTKAKEMVSIFTR